MTKTLNLAFATTLVAATLFGGSAALADGAATLAGGSYYEGIWPSAKQDRMIAEKRQRNPHAYTTQDVRTKRIGPADGDYYPGLDSSTLADR
ncbi:MAG TPA: hypothetical protein VGN93_04590 [Shinella sp.]|jgi:X-X-X-Leu-X-X-Gly heptad repeat protein|uniref:hypothetical protein n=1 Tax=Shinella sp. TaxID=1870904 RepID=UPI0029BB2C0C|nr:hypothetical protein [Shinella sp.]MDX3978032.1 hypothetical protein [Shinella sp.]HEV7246250.1 hypothetical protein [Shinella sp.]